ncbi:MAG TPA: hypothetical protein VGC41_19650 [Kofleriaceae bacterium]
MRGALLLAVVLAGCASTGGEECAMPSTVQYDCPTATRLKCTGGPLWTEGQDAPSEAFSVGCTAVVPECSTFSPGTTRALSCEVGPDGKPDWFEPL